MPSNKREKNVKLNSGFIAHNAIQNTKGILTKKSESLVGAYRHVRPPVYLDFRVIYERLLLRDEAILVTSSPIILRPDIRVLLATLKEPCYIGLNLFAPTSLLRHFIT